MPPSASKITLSPSELAQLEHAFATDPNSQAYRPLAEAYLSMGRFMEAMVVCKKGAKAHPELADPRVLLARVYAEQGKDKKALEEAQAALQVAPNDVAALRLAGDLLCKAGDSAGPEHLKKALGAAPNDPETIELCKKHQVALPPPPAPVAPPPVLTPRTNGASVHAAAEVGSPKSVAPSTSPVVASAHPSSEAASHGTEGAQTHTQPPRKNPQPKPQPRPVKPAVSYEDLAAKYGDPTDEPPTKKSSTGLIATVALFVLAAGGLVGYYFHQKATTERNQQIDRLLKQTGDELARDSYAGYLKACELGEKIVTELDAELFSAHAYLAYAYALRWGEHGEGDRAEKPAREHLEKAKAAGREHSHIIAAEAYIRFFSNDTKAATADLERTVADFEKQNRKSTLLMSTLGILEMHAGDLEKAQRWLKEAQKGAPADARINASLGNVLRRQGEESQAANAFEQALRYEKGHAESQLGGALMAIDSGKYETAESYAKKRIDADPPPSSRQIALAHMAYAIALDRAGKKADANRQQEKAFSLAENNGELRILKARRLLLGGDVDGAIASTREAISLEPNRAGFHVELAKMLMSKPGGAREAVATFEQAINTMGESPKMLVLLGGAYTANRDFDKAKQTYQKALGLARDKLPEARMGLADLARDQRDFTKALELYEKAKDEYLTSIERQAYAYTEMGRIYEQQSERGKALEAYRKASETSADYPRPYFFVGRLLAEDRDKTNKQKGIEFLNQYLQLAPDGEYAAEAQKLVK